MRSRRFGNIGMAAFFAALLGSAWTSSPGYAADSWGYVNVKGEFIVKPQFMDAGNFANGLAPVQINVTTNGTTDDRWGFINKQGELVVPATFDEAKEFGEGLAAVRNDDGKWGFIDTSGKYAIEAKFDRADRFSEGLAAASDGKKWGFIDKTGTWIIQPTFQVACKFQNGRAAVLINDGTGMLSIHTGEDIYTAQGGHWNYIDKSGKVVIESLFDGSGLFDGGLAPVAMGFNQGLTTPDKWGFINDKGTLAIKPRFAEVHAPSEGLIAIRLGQWKKIGQGFRTWNAGKWGYINTKGKQVIKAEFDGADPFSEGYAGILLNGKWGYIDKSGKVVIEPKFTANRGFHEELAPACVTASE